MGRVEKVFVVGAIVYMALYIPCFIVAAFAVVKLQKPDAFWMILPFHFTGMVLNLVAFALTIRDLYLRKFDSENAKLTWALLILMTGGIGWIVYIFKYAIKPRP